MTDLAKVFATNAAWRNRRLILHVGATKTGTTSVQYALDRQRAQLAALGVLYPEEGTREDHKPKHQWLVASLMGSETELAERLTRCLAEVTPTVETLILSTEGIFNHWWDFKSSGRDQLTELSVFFDLCVFLWLREPVEYYNSLYSQYLRNPRVPGIRGYGFDQSPREMLAIPWVAAHLDYASIIRDMQNVFGAENLFVFLHRDDTVADFWDLCGFENAFEGVERRNAGETSATGVELLRIINRLALPAQEKAAASRKLTEIEHLIKPWTAPSELTNDVIADIRALCPMTREDLLAIDVDSRKRWSARARCHVSVGSDLGLS